MKDLAFRRYRASTSDGRYLYYYWFKDKQRSSAQIPFHDGNPRNGSGNTLSPEMRWNPVRSEWNVIASHRQSRTFLPDASICPLCPTRDSDHPTEIPSPDFDVVAFENRFPSFVEPEERSTETVTGLYRTRPASGRCEVVVYTPKHDSSLASEDVHQVSKVVEVWRDRYCELAALSSVEYVLVFENRGEQVGVTLHHPHCQVYAFPFVPPAIEKELASSKRYLQETGGCLFCQILTDELQDGTRVVVDTERFVATVPFYARWPYEVHVHSKRHLGSLLEMDTDERSGLAAVLKSVAMKYDNLFGFTLPYVMALHQSPTDGGNYDHFHFHVEFYPPYRTADRLKYLAGVELGAGVFLNDAKPEEKAQELRDLEPRST